MKRNDIWQTQVLDAQPHLTTENYFKWVTSQPKRQHNQFVDDMFLYLWWLQDNGQYESRRQQANYFVEMRKGIDSLVRDLRHFEPLSDYKRIGYACVDGVFGHVGSDFTDEVFDQRLLKADQSGLGMETRCHTPLM